MKIWIVEASEPLPIVDENSRKMRCTILANHLLDAGHQVEWWTSNYSHIKKKYRFNQATTISVQPNFQIHLLQTPTYDKNISLQRILYNIVLVQQFEKAINDHTDRKPDLIFVCMPTLELAEKSVVYGNKHGIPVIVDTRDLWPDVYLTAIPKNLHGIFRFILATEFNRAKKIYQQATGIVAISQSYFDWSLDLAGRSQSVNDGIFPLGYATEQKIDLAEIEARKKAIIDKYDIGSNDLLGCFFGVFGKSYDLLTVVAAIKILDRQGISNIKILLAGGGDNEKIVKDAIEHCQSDNVILTGWIDQIDITAIMSIASVGIAPYTKQALQSLPNKPFEYMSASLAVISSLSGEFADLVTQEKIGINYQPGNAENLASALLWCVNNQVECQSYGVNARALLERQFSNESIYPQLVQHLESVQRDYQNK
jgi:glycosyltransferase involved in cell wall biosynthesis